MARKRPILDKYRQAETAEVPSVVEAKPEPVVMPAVVEPPKERPAAFREEDNPPEPVLVNLVGMSREGLERVAMREFGMPLDDDLSDDDALDRVRRLVEGRNKYGLL